MELIDIRTVKLVEDANRVDNASFFLEQIKSPTHFKDEGDIIVLEFSDTIERISDCLKKAFRNKNL